jgi:hypothetical protein
MTDKCSRCDASLVSDEKAHFVLGEVVCTKCATEIYKQKQSTVDRDKKIDSDRVGTSTLRTTIAEQRSDAIRRYAARLRRVAEFIMPDGGVLLSGLMLAAVVILATKWYVGIGVFISLGVLLAVLSMICGVFSFLLSLAVDIAEDIRAIRATLEKNKD